MNSKQADRIYLRSFLNVIVPLILGGGIYLLWRSSSLLMFEWVRAIGGQEILKNVRANTIEYRIFIPEPILYSFPDATWVYSATAYQLLVWKQRNAIAKELWILSALILGIGGEFGQLIKAVPGTFCLFDITLSLAAYIMARIIGK